MVIPQTIRVSRQGGNYSSCMGLYDLDTNDNQFWGLVTASFSTMPKPPPVDWRPQKRWYAVLHKFDGWGKHLGTDHWFAGTTAEGEKEVCARGRGPNSMKWLPLSARSSTQTSRLSCSKSRSTGELSGWSMFPSRNRGRSSRSAC